MNHPNRKLTPALRSMLERILARNGTLLELQITAAGGTEPTKLNKLRVAGWVEIVDHPTVIDREWDAPARALRVTADGAAALQALRLYGQRR